MRTFTVNARHYIRWKNGERFPRREKKLFKQIKNLLLSGVKPTLIAISGEIIDPKKII